jgi:2-polyprenyl-3-methyl-5-hydroxy-6-metoxy-1,4-benzoquinol methylase
MMPAKKAEPESVGSSSEIPDNLEFEMLSSDSPFSETADIETSSDEYASRFSGEIGKWFLKIQEEATLGMLAPFPQATILDVGGGHGQLTGVLIENNFSVTVIGSAEVCKARIQKHIENPKCSFEVGDVLNLPFDDQEFDVVISYRLLAHVEQWQKFLSELTRVASKSVIIDYPEARSFNALSPFLYDFKKNIEGNTRTYKIFRESDLLPIFKSNNFFRERRFAEFFFPMVLHRKINSLKFSSSVEAISRFLGLTGLLGSPVILEVNRQGR